MRTSLVILSMIAGAATLVAMQYAMLTSGAPPVK
jgi:hypothetical protein